MPGFPSLGRGDDTADHPRAGRPATEQNTVDVLVDLVLASPGRAAASSALQILRDMARTGEFAAITGLCRLIASELGVDPGEAGLTAAADVSQLVHAPDVAPLIRLYALGFHPQLLILEPGIGELAEQAEETPIDSFQALVERHAPIESEILKAYLIAAHVKIYSGFGADLSAGAKLAALDQIVNNGKVIPGDATDSSFEFGRDAILSWRTNTGLLFVIYHEFGHHIFSAFMAGDRADRVSADTETLIKLARALPAMHSAAVARVGQPFVPDDSRILRLPNGLSMICSVEPHPDATYTHYSLTDRAGPIERDTALVVAWYLLTAIGGTAERIAAAMSPRGVFHFGVVGLPATAPSQLLWLRLAGRSDAKGLDLDAGGRIAAAERWFSELVAAGRIGHAEADIRYLLGVAKRPTIFYGDPAVVAADLDLLADIADADLKAVPEGTRLELLNVGVRCGHPPTVARLGLSVPVYDRHQLSLADLGASMLVWRDGLTLGLVGPESASLLSVLQKLHEMGYPLDDVVTDDGQTLLTDAAARNGSLVASLLRVGLVVDHPNSAGQTALMRALLLNRLDIAWLLLDAGAAATSRDNIGRRPLHHAVWSGSVDVIRFLVRHGADVNASSHNGETALFSARSADTVVALHELGGHLDAHDNSGTTALMVAAGRADLNVVQALLQAGADPEAATDLGAVALHFAARSNEDGAAPVISALLDSGASIDEETDDGMTPLMLAADEANTDALSRLLERGASLEGATRSGNTALILASDGRTESGRGTATDRMLYCIRSLAGAGADLNAVNDNDETALHWAVTSYSAEAVEALLQLGANPNVRNKDGKTPLGMARQRQQVKMIEDLVAAGAKDDG